MTQIDTDRPLADRLARLGEALDRAVRADLAAGRLRRARLLARPRILLGAAVAAVAVPAAAIAATQLLTTSQVAASLPQGTRALIGTDPSCTVVVTGVEYHCVLATPPASLGAPAGAGVTSPSSAGAIQFHDLVRAAVTRLDGTTTIIDAGSAPALERKLLSLGRVRRWVVLAGRRSSVRAPALSGAGREGTSATASAGQGTAATSSATGWQGTVEPTVDATLHVNGGCRALTPAGTEWECYIGQAAVAQNIISAGFLGQYAPSPGVG